MTRSSAYRFAITAWTLSVPVMILVGATREDQKEHWFAIVALATFSWLTFVLGLTAGEAIGRLKEGPAP